MEKRVDDSLIQRLLVEHRIMLNYDRYKRARPFTNQHDHVLRSNAWSCFSFRDINQHDHVLRSNAWSCFSLRTINHMTMSFTVMLGHISFSGMRPVGPGCVSGQDTLLKVAQY